MFIGSWGKRQENYPSPKRHEDPVLWEHSLGTYKQGRIPYRSSGSGNSGSPVRSCLAGVSCTQECELTCESVKNLWNFQKYLGEDFPRDWDPL